MKKIEKIKADFKKFQIWISSLAGLGALCLVLSNYSAISSWLSCVGGLDLATFIVTLAAFIAAGLAFVWQHKSLNEQIKSGREQQLHNEQILKGQDRQLKIQQELGAWQVLANKAAGNSGKIEAIEFLAKQGKSLQGIDMSSETHNGEVYLKNLNVSKDKLGKKVDLRGINFKGADLWEANFEGADLSDANFEMSFSPFVNFKDALLQDANFKGANLTGTCFKDSILKNAHFEGADLWEANFEGANLRSAYFQGTILNGAYFKSKGAYVIVYFSENLLELLPKTSSYNEFKFEIDPEKKPEPLGFGDIKYFIHLVPKTPNQQ